MKDSSDVTYVFQSSNSMTFAMVHSGADMRVPIQQTNVTHVPMWYLFRSCPYQYRRQLREVDRIFHRIQSIRDSHNFSTRRTSTSISSSSIKLTMKISAAVVAAFATGASAFTSSSHKAPSTTELQYSKYWTPDPSAFAQGLPGSLAPVGEFDPLGFAKDADEQTIKKYREAELQHGRVAMLAVAGMLITEEPIEFHPLFDASVKDIGPAIRHLDEVRAVEPYFFGELALLIGTLEFNRALTGWQSPGDGSGLLLKEDYFPGDINFDPLGLKPEDPEEFLAMHTKELQNGRLAMLGIAGMVAQELVNGKEIFVNLGLATDRFDHSVLPVQF